VCECEVSGPGTRRDDERVEEGRKHTGNADSAANAGRRVDDDERKRILKPRQEWFDNRPVGHRGDGETPVLEVRHFDRARTVPQFHAPARAGDQLRDMALYIAICRVGSYETHIATGDHGKSDCTAHREAALRRAQSRVGNPYGHCEAPRESGHRAQECIVKNAAPIITASVDSASFLNLRVAT
jgi:hypothetical protein